MLAAHRILSAPVVTTTTTPEGGEQPDSAEPSERTKDVAGFIDIRDILSSFLQGRSRCWQRRGWLGTPQYCGA